MKTALIFTGGTIGSAVGSDGYISPSGAGKYDILKGFDSEMFDIFEPYTILSENLDGAYITALLECIREALKNHGGVIVLHGTDTLQYAAAAAGYAFGLGSPPIVFVSSNYILSDSRANGRDNFAGAVDFAANARGTGAFIAYKNPGEDVKIHRAARVLPYAPYSDIIESVGGEYGRYENKAFIPNGAYSEPPDEILPFGIPDMSRAKIQRLCAYPEMEIGAADAVLIETYHSGTVCESVMRNTDAKIFLLGHENRVQYASVKSQLRGNITVLEKAAAPAMYIKLKMAFAAGRQNDVTKPLGGDFARN